MGAFLCLSVIVGTIRHPERRNGSTRQIRATVFSFSTRITCYVVLQSLSRIRRFFPSSEARVSARDIVDIQYRMNANQLINCHSSP